MHEDRDWISRSPPTGPERMLQGCLSCCFESGPPNGSRLSCGRNACRRKEVEPQTKRLAGEATQFFPHERPAASSACRSEEHTSELQSQSNLVCRLLLEKKKLETLEIVVHTN